VLEEQVSNLAGHFRYLALLLDAYDKRCPKIDRFVQQLQFSNTSISGGISRKRNIVPSSHSVCNRYVGGATSSCKTDDRSNFRSPDVGVRIIDVSDNSFTLAILY
jgi:hypothetical protein